jgi:hypothetical protein
LIWLKGKLRRELYSSRPTAAKEWVADSDVTGGSNLITAISDFTVAG